MSHRLSLKVRFYELDPYNHVNHSAYIQYFEAARIELLESVGFGLAHLQESGYHLVVTGITTRFLRSAGPGDVLDVETVVADIKRATSSWNQQIARGGELLATQIVDAAMTDKQGRPTRFPADLADALAPYRLPPPR